MVLCCIGLGAVSEGAPTTSACGSTVSKCLVERRMHFVPKLLKPGMDAGEGSALMRTDQFEGSITPFGSQLSTPCSKFKETCNVIGTAKTASPLYDAPATAADVSANMSIPVPSPGDTEGRHAGSPVHNPAAADIDREEAGRQVDDGVPEVDDGGTRNGCDFFIVDDENPILQCNGVRHQEIASSNIPKDSDIAPLTQVTQISITPTSPASRSCRQCT